MSCINFMFLTEIHLFYFYNMWWILISNFLVLTSITNNFKQNKSFKERIFLKHYIKFVAPKVIYIYGEMV